MIGLKRKLKNAQAKWVGGTSETVLKPKNEQRVLKKVKIEVPNF